MNEKITIQDIANSLKEKQGLTKKDAELFVKSMFDIMKEALASDKYVKVKGLGTFKLTEVESRESINVNTGERFEIQGHTKISFTPDTTLKEQINKPFSVNTEDPNSLTYISERGRPYSGTAQISSLSGFIQCEGASINCAASATEKEEINNYLNSGFYYI